MILHHVGPSLDLHNLVRMSQRSLLCLTVLLLPHPFHRGVALNHLPTWPILNVLLSHIVLVIDTNILRSSISEVTCLVDSNRWTTIIPQAGGFKTRAMS